MLTKNIDFMQYMLRNYNWVPFLLFFDICVNLPFSKRSITQGGQLVINRRGAQYPSHHSFSVSFYRRSVVPMKRMILIER